jgi:hypothetical protein
MLDITIGNIESGNLRMLNRERDTKAFSASRILLTSTITYTANVTKHT